MEFITLTMLIDAFLAGETKMHTWSKQKPGPLRIINDKIISYETVICERFGDKFIINPTLYSRNTEKAQKMLIKRIPADKQILTTKRVPYIYWGSLLPYIDERKWH